MDTEEDINVSKSFALLSQPVSFKDKKWNKKMKKTNAYVILQILLLLSKEYNISITKCINSI